VATVGSGANAGSLISGRYPADRFLMALLRACADAVLIGAGTLRGSPGHVWTPGHVYPQLAESFAGLRRSLGRAPEPRLVVLTASGAVETGHAAIRQGATIITTDAGARAIQDLPSACDVVSLGAAGMVDPVKALGEMRNRGYSVVLTEGGPHMMGSLLEKELVDEAFITISPLLSGRDRERRLGMIEGVELEPPPGRWSRLLSARRHGDYMFLRYSTRR
jgi:riboflavin biosynthesis pyrimidine reductase